MDGTRLLQEQARLSIFANAHAHDGAPGGNSGSIASTDLSQALKKSLHRKSTIKIQALPEAIYGGSPGEAAAAHGRVHRTSTFREHGSRFGSLYGGGHSLSARFDPAVLAQEQSEVDKENAGGENTTTTTTISTGILKKTSMKKTKQKANQAFDDHEGADDQQVGYHAQEASESHTYTFLCVCVLCPLPLLPRQTADGRRRRRKRRLVQHKMTATTPRAMSEGESEAARRQWCSDDRAWGREGDIVDDDGDEDSDQGDDNGGVRSDGNTGGDNDESDASDAKQGGGGGGEEQREDGGDENGDAEPGPGRSLDSSSSISSIESLFLDELEPREVYLLGCKAADILPSSRLLRQLASDKVLTVLDMEYVTVESQVRWESTALCLGGLGLNFIVSSPRRVPGRSPTACCPSRASRRSSCGGRG